MSIPAGVDAGLLRELDRAVAPDRVVRTLSDLIRIPSENPFDAGAGDGEGEADVASYLSERAAALGLESERTDIGPRRCNLLVRRRGKRPGPRLHLAGHMDTVRTSGYADAYSGELRHGRVHGRGACDMKGAIACYLEVLEVLAELEVPLTGELGLLGVADEEYTMRGAQHIGRHGPGADAIIMGEPTDMRLCTASKGRVSTFIVTTGRAAHSSVPETGVNAIGHMGRVLRAIEAHADELAIRGVQHPLLGRPRLNPGVITGGVQVNMVPPECRLEIDRRTLPHEDADSVYGELEAVIERVRDEISNLDWHLTDPSWLIPPYEIPVEHPFVSQMTAALEASGTNGTPVGFGASSDAAHFGIPTVICGPGSIDQAHTSDEWVSVEQLELATRTYLNAAVSILGTA